MSFPGTEVLLVCVRGQGGCMTHKTGPCDGWCLCSGSCRQQGLPQLFAQLSSSALLAVNPAPLSSAGKELREDNKDYQQVLLDVRRSLRRFPPGEREGRAMGLLPGLSSLGG